MAKIKILNGPNLNLLGKREPHLYGSDTLADVVYKLTQLAQSNGHELRSFQSNAEHELITAIHEMLTDETQFIIFNPGAFTHTSVALRDALLAVKIPFIEVHISNVFARETFRQHSYLSDIATGVISGLGVQGYELALLAAHQYLTQH